MKKLLIALFALATMGNVFAGYKIEMRNNSDDVMKIDIDYLGESKTFNICRSDSITLQAGEYKSLDVGICCTSRVVVTALSGSYANLPYEYMKVAKTCGGFGFTIIVTKFGGVQFEKGASRPRQGSGSRIKRI